MVFRKLTSAEKEARECYMCNNSNTWVSSKGHSAWYFFGGKPFCHKCHAKIFKIFNPEKIKELNAKYNPRKIVFKDKRILLKENPRKGICHDCGRSVSKKEIQVTNMHHEKYDENDPLAHTVELCAACHWKKHNYSQDYWKRKKRKNNQN